MILVTGASGFIGRHLVSRLLADGRPVRCLLQSNKSHRITWDSSVETVTGSVLDEEFLFKAVTGVHTIIHLESAQWWGRLRDLERIELVGTRNLITAARSARVGRIIVVSHLGASVSSAFALLRVKGTLEELIRTSGLAYTIIRSGLVFGKDDAFVNHIAMILRASPFIFLMPGQGEVVLHPIFIDDLVEALARSLEKIDVVDSTVEIGGPEYITLEDMISTVMRVSNVSRVVLPTPPYLLRLLTGVYSRVLPRSLMTSQWFDLLAANRTTSLGNLYNAFGFQPRRFEDTLLTYMPKTGYWWTLLRASLHRRPRSI